MQQILNSLFKQTGQKNNSNLNRFTSQSFLFQTESKKNNMIYKSLILNVDNSSEREREREREKGELVGRFSLKQTKCRVERNKLNP